MRSDRLGKVLKKLVTGEIGELRDRAREEMRRREDRRIHTAGRSIFDPNRHASIFKADFRQRFGREDADIDFVSALRSHTDGEFVPGFATRQRFRQYVESTNSDETKRLIAAADQIMKNRFPIFNLGFISYGDPPRWNYDPILKITAPELFYADIDYLDPLVVGDSKVVWELSRFQFVYDLGQAYLLTGADKYAQKFLELVYDWRAHNRDYHGINFCSALESAFRLHSLIWGIWFFKDSPSLSHEYAKDIYDVAYASADFLRHHLSRHFAPNTHLFGEAYALFLVGVLFPEFADALKWQRLGHDILIAELDRQFTPDGMHAELSTAYHAYAVEFLLSIAALARQHGIVLEKRFEHRLQQGTEVLASLQRPDGCWPHIGDEDGGRLFFLSRVPASDFRPLLEACRSFLSPDQFAAPTRYVDSFWFTGAVKQGGAGTVHADLTAPDAKRESHSPLTMGDQGGCHNSGIIVSRSLNGMYSAFQCGPFGYLDSPHSHADMLHLDISVGSDNFLVDPGTHVYTADLEKRNLYRSSAMHNGPTLVGLTLENPRDPFGWLQKPDCKLDCLFRTPHSEFYRAAYQLEVSRGVFATLSRSILFVSDQMWVIFDSVQSPIPVEPIWNLVIPSECKLDCDTIVTKYDTRRLILMPFSLNLLRIGKYPKDCPVSDDYLSLRGGSRVTYSTEPSTVSNVQYLILPRGPKAQIPIPSGIRRLSEGTLTHFTEGATETIIIEDAPEGACQGLEWNAEIVMLQVKDGSPQRLIVIGGTKVIYNSRELFRAKSRADCADITWEGENAQIETAGTADLIVPLRQTQS